MQKEKTYTSKELRVACIFLLPLLTFILLFIFIPVIGTVGISFYRDVSFLQKEVVFFKNYLRLFSDPLFWQSLKFTLLFILISVPLEIVLGLFFAIILNSNLPFQGFLRACVLIPWAIPSAISARIWELIYSYTHGLANYIVISLGLSQGPLNWLGTTRSALMSVVISDVWKTTPFVIIIFLAGLQIIPMEIYDQARVDRANFFQIFYKITLPLLKPVIIVAFLFRTIDALRIFDLIYVLTHGGPGGSTTSLSLYAYKYLLSGDFGYGAAVSVLLFFIALLLSIFYIKAGRFKDQLI